MKKTLRPIMDKNSYSDHIARVIEYELFHLIYKPLLDLLDPPVKENAKSMTLAKAFQTGRLEFVDGYVYGKFNATLSKELRAMGGSFSASKKAFKIAYASFPPDIKSVIVLKIQKDKDQVALLKKKTQELSEAEAITLKLGDSLDHTVADLEKQFRKVTPEDLEIPIDLDGHAKKSLQEKFQDNVNTYAMGWSKEAMDRLRYKVEQNAAAGYRADTLKKVIMAEYGITQKRAKFIARQEMSLMVSAYRQVRYESAGVNRYVWSTSNDERVRADHKELNGREFSFDNPPIVDKHTGKRGNPGEDWNCRCVALPVINFAEV